MGEEELKVGMMTKRAQQKKSIGPTNYKDRVFVLTPTKLSYYEGSIQQRGKIKGSISISAISFVGNINDSSLQGTNTFQLCYNDCYLYCCPKTAWERDDWINTIKQACSSQGNVLKGRYHPKIFSSGKWQCCSKAERQAPGCLRYDEMDRKKALPSLPVPGPSYPRRNTLDNTPVRVSSAPSPMLPPLPQGMVLGHSNSVDEWSSQSRQPNRPLPNQPSSTLPTPPKQKPIQLKPPALPGMTIGMGMKPSEIAHSSAGWNRSRDTSDNVLNQPIMSSWQKSNNNYPDSRSSEWQDNSRESWSNNSQNSGNLSEQSWQTSNSGNSPSGTWKNPSWNSSGFQIAPTPSALKPSWNKPYNGRSDVQQQDNISETSVPAFGSGANYPKSHASHVQIPTKGYEHSNLNSSALSSQPIVESNQTPEPMTVIAIYDFEPQEHGDIVLRVGDLYTVLETNRPHWWKVRDPNGVEGYIPANYVKETTGDGLEVQKWFQKDLSRQRAELLLKQDGKEGSFVIRNSSQPAVVYTLSVVSKAGMINGPSIVKHYHIRQNDQQQYYLSEKHAHPTIQELINYHKHNAGGLVTRLRQAPQSILGTGQPSTHLFSDSKWEIDINELTFDRELGSGQFGVVRFGQYRGQIDVALKIMKDGTMEEDQFIEEAEVMTKLDHPNLVKLYGVVTKQRPICIVTEFMEGGCLLDYIRKNQYLQTHPDMLLDFSNQVCDAMKYLESINTIHRDLAARNCLVGGGHVIKVADFGLSRYVLDDEYTSSLGSKFPIKWAAPEVLNYTKFSSKSDVWAFGVLMWELFTGGKTPYRALSNTDVVEKVARGHRLERPPNCPHDVYHLMLQTWDMEPEKRPSFEQLFALFPNLIDDIAATCTPDGTYDAN